MYMNGKMVETELARLRFLSTRSMKGERLTTDDIDFVLRMKDSITSIQQGIDSIIANELHAEEHL